MKKVYLDMDGTIADLYSIDKWLERLLGSDKAIFTECKPLITEKELFKLFPPSEFDIRILSMTPKGCTKEYGENVKQQKDKWLDMYFPSLKKRIYKSYSHNKNLKGSSNAILIDDNEEIRRTYKGLALDPMTIWG